MGDGCEHDDAHHMTDGSPPPDTFTDATLHSVVNHLALIVSYVNLMLMEAPDTPQAGELNEIKTAARTAAKLLGRPFEST